MIMCSSIFISLLTEECIDDSHVRFQEKIRSCFVPNQHTDDAFHPILGFALNGLED
jgi:hypothetical protein